jgi:hypothetical protein
MISILFFSLSAIACQSESPASDLRDRSTVESVNSEGDNSDQLVSAGGLPSVSSPLAAANASVSSIDSISSVLPEKPSPIYPPLVAANTTASAPDSTGSGSPDILPLVYPPLAAANTTAGTTDLTSSASPDNVPLVYPPLAAANTTAGAVGSPGLVSAVYPPLLAANTTGSTSEALMMVNANQSASSSSAEISEEASIPEESIGPEVSPDPGISDTSTNTNQETVPNVEVEPVLLPALPESVGENKETATTSISELSLLRNPDSIPLATQAGLRDETENPEDINFAQSLFVDIALGEDSQSGNIDSAFKTVSHGISRLTAGMTLYIREGNYFENNLNITASGSQADIIRIRNYPGEKVVINGSLPDFYQTYMDNWQLYEAATNTYRSADSSFGSDLYTGYAMADNENWIRLITYTVNGGEKSSGLADLTAETESVSNLERYVGPGIFNDSGRLYIRLETLEEATVHNEGLSEINVGTDPNLIKISIASTTPVLRIASSYVEIEGLTITGGGKGILLESTSSHVVISDTTFMGLSIAIVAEEGVDNVVVDHCEIDARFPAYLAWTDMKGTDGQSKPGAHWLNKVAGLTGRQIDSLTFSNNYFNETFDGLVISGADVNIFGNAGFFVDDFVQLGSDSSNVKINSNRVLGAGPSHYGRGNSSAPGTIYIYQNVIDTSREILWGKLDPQNVLRSSYSGWGEQKPFQSHAKSAVEDGDPWKIYNNTVVFDSSENGFGLGIELFGDQNSTGKLHEVYNNILIETGGGIFTKNINIALDNQIYDGNIYWSSSLLAGPIFSSMKNFAQSSENFYSLNDFRASDHFLETISQVSTGWESNGLQVDPQLSVAMVPSLDTPATTTGFTLPSNLPGTGLTYKGALAPAEGGL